MTYHNHISQKREKQPCITVGTLRPFMEHAIYNRKVKTGTHADANKTESPLLLAFERTYDEYV